MLFPSRPAGLPGGKQRKETLLRKLANPPHMSPDSDCIWRAAALQTSRNDFFDSMSCLPVGRQLAFGWLTTAGASAAASRAQTAQPIAVDDGDHRRRTAVGDRHAPAADRACDGGYIFIGRGEQLFDRVCAGRQATDDQRFVELQAAAGAQREDFAIGIAGAGDADIECPGRAALVAAGLQHDFVDDERGAVFVAGAAVVRLAAAERMFPLGIRAAGMHRTRVARAVGR